MEDQEEESWEEQSDSSQSTPATALQGGQLANAVKAEAIAQAEKSDQHEHSPKFDMHNLLLFIHFGPCMDR